MGFVMQNKVHKTTTQDNQETSDKDNKKLKALVILLGEVTMKSNQLQF